MSQSESLIHSSEDEMEITLTTGDGATDQPHTTKAITANKALLEALPSKEDVHEHFEKIPKKINGMDCCYCKYCLEESKVDDDVKVAKTRFNPETMLRHLCRCKYFQRKHGIKVKSRSSHSVSKPEMQVLGSYGGKKPKIQPVVEHVPISKTITVKYSRRTETFEITDNMTGKDVIESLKEIFDIDDDQKCLLRRESERKVLLDCNNLFILLHDNEVLKLEHAPVRKL